MEYTIYTSLEEARDNGIERVREDVYELWQECFHDAESYMDFYFEWVVPYNRIFTLYQGERLCSMLHLNPYTLGVRGTEIRSDYIVGVATRIEERRKGYMGLLIDKAFQCMYEEGKPFTYLMPAAESIYYPYDFRIVYIQESWVRKIKAAALRGGKGKTRLELIKLTASDKESRKVLAEFTEDILKREYDVYTIRSRKYYEKLLTEMESAGGGVTLITQGDIPVGYAAYMLEEGLSLAECIGEPVLKQEMLMRLQEEFSDSFKEEGDFIPSIMMRIVNLKTFLLGLRAEERISLIMEVRDDRIDENNGVWWLQCDEEESLVTPVDTSPQLRGGIAELTQLFFGQLEKEEIDKLIVEEEKEEIWNQILKIHLYQKLFINDVV